MPLFYPFGIPTTSSYAVSASRTDSVKVTPGVVPAYALYGQSGPKGTPGLGANGCPPGYLNASVVNTVTGSDVNGTHVYTYPPLPYKARREEFDTPRNISNAYILCYPVPVPTPTNKPPFELIRQSAISQSVTASNEVVPGSGVDASVQVVNDLGNPVSYPVPVTWSIRPPVNGAYLISSSNFTDALGNSQVTGWFAGTITGSQYIEASSTSTPGSVIDFHIQIVPSSSSHLGTTATLSTDTVIAGNEVQITVDVKDQFGNRLTYVSGLGIPLSNPYFVTTLGDDVVLLSNGFECNVGFCFATVRPKRQAGTWVTLETRINGQLLTTGGSLSVTTNPAALNYFTISGDSTQIAGESQNITIRAYDVYGNIINAGPNIYAGTKSITFSGAISAPDNTSIPTVNGTIFGQPTDVAFTSGSGSAAMILYDARGNPESDTISITSPVASTTNLSVAVSPATAASYLLSSIGTVITDSSPTLTIVARDAYLNEVRSGTNSYTGDKSLTFSGASAGPNGTLPTARDKDNANINFGSATTITFTNGEASSVIRFKLTQTGTLTATGPAQSPGTGTIAGTSAYVVGPGALNNFAITGTATQIAGAGQIITVEARDTYNNRVNGANSGTNYNGSIGGHIFTGASASPGGNTPTVAGTTLGSGTTLSFTNGVAQPTMVLYDATGQPENDTISMTAPVASAVNLSVAVSPANPLTTPFGSIDVAGSTTQTAGVSQNVTLRVYDAYRNLCASGTHTYHYPSGRNITFSGADPSPNNTKPTAAGTAFDAGAKSIVFTNGVSDPVAMVLYDAEVDTISVNDPVISSTYSGDTLTVTVSPNTAVDIGMIKSGDDNTFSTIAGVSNTIDFTAYDAYRNVATGYSGTKTLRFSGASNAPIGTEPTVNGSADAFKTPGVGINFSSGTVSVPMVLYKVESPTIDFDNLTDANVDPLDSGDTLSVTVNRTTTTMTIKQGDGETETVGTNVSPTPEVYIRDTYWNPHVGQTVTWTISSGGGSRTNATNATDSNGVATVGGWTLGTTAGSNNNTLTASASGYSNVVFTATAQPAAVNYLTLTYDSGGTSTGNMKAGGAGESGQSDYFVLVTAKDVYGNTCNFGTNNINGYYSVIWDGASTSPGGNGTSTAEAPKVGNNDGDFLTTFGQYSGRTFTNGTCVYKLRLYTVETANLAADLYTYPDNVLLASENATHAVAVALGPIGAGQGTMGLNSTQYQTPVVNTAATAPSVKVTDDYGNVASGINVEFVRSAGSGTLTGGGIIQTNGSGIATVTSWTMPTVASDNATDYDETVTAYCGTTPDNIVFYAAPRPAAVASLALTKDVGTITAGTDFNLTVTTKDTYNNTVSWGSNAWGYQNIYFSGPALAPDTTAPRAQSDVDALPPTGPDWVYFPNQTGRTFSNGAATFPMTLYKVETVTLTASTGYSGGPTGTQGTLSVTVVAGAEDTGESSAALTTTTITAGNNTTLTLTLKDAYGNLRDGLDNVTFVTTIGHNVTGGTRQSLGVYTFTYTPPTTAGTYTNALSVGISYSDVVGSPFTTTVTAAETTKLVMSTQPAGTVTYQQTGSGNGLTFGVRTQDQYNNNTPTASVTIGSFGVLSPSTATTNESGIATFSDAKLYGYLGPTVVSFDETPSLGWTGTSANSTNVYGTLYFSWDQVGSTGFSECTQEACPPSCCESQTWSGSLFALDAQGTEVAHTFTENVGVRVIQGSTSSSFLIAQNNSVVRGLESSDSETYPGEGLTIEVPCFVSASNTNWNVVLNGIDVCP